MKIETLAATQDRRQNFLRLGRGEYELYVRRRFFECFEQSVECRGAQHVDFVDDINFEMPFARGVTDVVPQFAHLFDAVVARAINLEHIQAVAGRDFLAAVANAARRYRRAIYAVERLRQNPGRRSLPDPARSHEKVGVREPFLLDRVLQRSRHVCLSNEVVERLGTIFSRENLIAHVLNLIRFNRARKQKSENQGTAVYKPPTQQNGGL